MITEDEFNYLTTHPPRRLRSQSHRYGTLGTGVPGFSSFRERKPSLRFTPVNLAWHRLMALYSSFPFGTRFFFSFSFVVVSEPCGGGT